MFTCEVCYYKYLIMRVLFIIFLFDLRCKSISSRLHFNSQQFYSQLNSYKIIRSTKFWLTGYHSYDFRRLQKRTKESRECSTCVRMVLQTDESLQHIIRLLPSIQNIPSKDWNSLLPHRDSVENSNPNGPSLKDAYFCPFLMHEWFHALESSNCASAEEGWQPLHMLVYRQVAEDETGQQNQTQQLLAALPLYVKYHSQGEFIFDHQWANFAETVLGIRYYPKLLSAVPMTPATGSRLLVLPSLTSAETQRIFESVASTLKQITVGNKLASANINFMLPFEAANFMSQDFSLRETIQYRWENYNNLTQAKYANFDDYLSCFKSKRRVQIKSERRKVYVDQSISVLAINGADEILADEQFYLMMYELYTTTVRKMWGTQYLNAEFFLKLHQSPSSFRKHLVFMVAVDRSNLTLSAAEYVHHEGLGRVVAGTINMVSDSHFYGRYWGAFSYHNNLHFEVCYYKAIEYCIEKGISFMEPGAGGGEFKFLRGFDPYTVSSVHWFANVGLARAVDNFLLQERSVNQETKNYLIENSALSKKGDTSAGE